MHGMPTKNLKNKLVLPRKLGSILFKAHGIQLLLNDQRLMHVCMSSRFKTIDYNVMRMLAY